VSAAAPHGNLARLNRIELRQSCLSLPKLQRIAAKYPHNRDSNIGVHVTENPMYKRVISCVPTVFTVIMLGANSAALAASDCLAGANRQPVPGGHWYYRVDHASNRKCWYLVEPGARTLAADSLGSQPPLAAAPPPTLSSFFSSLTGSLTGAAPGTQLDLANSNVRSTQSGRPDDPRNDEATSRQRMTRLLDAQAAVIPKQHRPTRARPPGEAADERSAPPLDQATRDALFQQFMRWKDRQIP